MKKIVQIIAFCGIVMMTVSCSRYIAPPFTDVSKVTQIKPNMKVKQVIDLLGVEPYDVFYMQETGAQMLSFNYRLKKRIMYAYNTVNLMEAKRQTSNEDSQKAGDLYYDKNYRTVYAMFSKDGDLINYITTSGAKDEGKLIVYGNTIKLYEDKKTTELDADYIKANNPIYIDINRDGTLDRKSTRLNSSH